MSAGRRRPWFRQTIAGPGGRAVCGEFQITEARPGAEIQYRALTGPERTHGGYYLSTEGGSTRVRFALECEPRGILARLKLPFWMEPCSSYNRTLGSPGMQPPVATSLRHIDIRA